MAVLKTWNATALTGGAVRALDAIPVASLTDLDRAFVVASSTIYYYEFDSAATDAEASPSFIRPDDYSTAGVWKLSRWYTQEDAYESNLFINSNFIVNQEAYVSGVITTGSYGHDMMKSISSASYTFASSALTMVSGTLGQRNDDLIAVDGTAVTISVQSGSLTIGATAGAAATVITSGAPYSWTLDMSGSAFITITDATAAYGIKIERGSTATNYVVPEPRSEEARCLSFLWDLLTTLFFPAIPNSTILTNIYVQPPGNMSSTPTVASVTGTAYDEAGNSETITSASVSGSISGINGSVTIALGHAAMTSQLRMIEINTLELDARY